MAKTKSVTVFRFQASFMKRFGMRFGNHVLSSSDSLIIREHVLVSDFKIFTSLFWPIG